MRRRRRYRAQGLIVGVLLGRHGKGALTVLLVGLLLLAFAVDQAVHSLIFWLVVLGLAGFWLARRYDKTTRWPFPTTPPVVLLHDRPTFLYRAFDTAGGLLYVGIAVDVGRRLNQERGEPWYPRMVRYTAVSYPTRALAMDAEREAFERERPIYNRLRPPAGSASLWG